MFSRAPPPTHLMVHVQSFVLFLYSGMVERTYDTASSQPSSDWRSDKFSATFNIHIPWHLFVKFCAESFWRITVYEVSSLSHTFTSPKRFLVMVFLRRSTYFSIMHKGIKKLFRLFYETDGWVKGGRMTCDCWAGIQLGIICFSSTSSQCSIGSIQLFWWIRTDKNKHRYITYRR